MYRQLVCCMGDITGTLLTLQLLSVHLTVSGNNTAVSVHVTDGVTV